MPPSFFLPCWLWLPMYGASLSGSERPVSLLCLHKHPRSWPSELQTIDSCCVIAHVRQICTLHAFFKGKCLCLRYVARVLLDGIFIDCKCLQYIFISLIFSCVYQGCRCCGNWISLRNKIIYDHHLIKVWQQVKVMQKLEVQWQLVQ